jgi:hypothetical protein
MNNKQKGIPQVEFPKTAPPTNTLPRLELVRKNVVVGCRILNGKLACTKSL